MEHMIVRLKWASSKDMTKELMQELKGGWKVVSSSQDNTELTLVAVRFGLLGSD